MALAVIGRARSVPEGFVTTYGDLCPPAPRFAGAVLAQTDQELPWHRVVRADGSLAKGRRQRTLLEAEGIPFRGRRVDMREALFPREELSPSAGSPAAARPWTSSSVP
jgi:methylated-DNA-protein-cysteine methyltransferase-like protein